MYLFEDMIDLGLKDGQKFPTKSHRDVAIALCIGNRSIKSRDDLREVVQNIIKMSKKDVENKTYEDFLYDERIAHFLAQ